MRAMIVAAGLGTRLRPLTALRPKPVLPLRGLPLIGFGLALLARAGAREVAVNVHHLPERMMADTRAVRPEGMALRFSHEPRLLHTGGAIRRMAGFLRESDPCLVVGGDMLLDLDLAACIARHRASGRDTTLVLVDDPRGERFGTVGIDRSGRICRVGDRFHRPGEVAAGVYTWLNLLSPRAFDTLPDREVMNHLDDWWIPRLAAGDPGVGAEVLERARCHWEPVGTPQEYLRANLVPLRLSYLDADARARAAGVRLEPGLVVGAGATLGPGAELQRAVVWDGERVPAGFRGENGVFAGGRFHPVAPRPAAPAERAEEAGQ